jgi:hypothetical protein
MAGPRGSGSAPSPRHACPATRVFLEFPQIACRIRVVPPPVTALIVATLLTVYFAFGGGPNLVLLWDERSSPSWEHLHWRWSASASCFVHPYGLRSIGTHD